MNDFRRLLTRIEEYVNVHYHPAPDDIAASLPDVLEKVDISQALQHHSPGESLYDTTMRYLRRLDNPAFLRKNGEINEAAFYKYARIEKSNWSRIRLGEAFPRKETLLKLVIALHLNEKDASTLLSKASCSFNDTDLRDMVILACLDIRCYDIETIYEILEEYADNGPDRPRRFKNIYGDI